MIPVGDEPFIVDDKVLRLEVAMEDLLVMTSGHGVTHLREHGRNKAKAGLRENNCGWRLRK